MSRFGLLCFWLLLAPSIKGASSCVTDTSTSPFAKVTPLGLREVHWTSGFWFERSTICVERTVPALGVIMEGTNYSQFFQNFRIAAGLAEGKHHGAPFNDGDFYKWLESASAVLALTNDVVLEQHLDAIIVAVAKAQRADGYLHTPLLIKQRNDDTEAQPFQDPLQFEMYNIGHLLTAACVHYRVTGKTNLLQVAIKAADFIDHTFREPTPGLARSEICPTHYMGLIELYRVTREPRYLDLAKRLFAMRTLVSAGTDDNQDRIPFTQQTEAMGHAARANYLYAGAADLFLETGDHSLWSPLEGIWTNLVQEKMYITGGCGALYDGASPDAARDQKSIARVHQAYGRNFQLPNTTAHNETCANIASVLWNWRMFLATGEARFMDVVELALYNSVISGEDLAGTNFCYVNPLRTTDPLPVELRWNYRRAPFISVFCCPPNLARTIAEANGYACAKSRDALWINLYGSSCLKTRLPDGQHIKLREQTEYPWNGRVRFVIEDYSGNDCSLKLRIPAWCKGASVRVNCGPAEVAHSAGYLDLRRAWRTGDIVDLDLPMTPQIFEANPLVEETLNQVAVQRGPLVYCLESTDLPHGLNPLDVLVPSNLDLVARFDPRLFSGVVVLDGKAVVQPKAPWNHQLYRAADTSPIKPVLLRFVPYFAWGNRGSAEMSVWIPRTEM